MTARILIVDDHELAREALRSILSREPDLMLIGEAGDGTTALDLARTLQPDLVLMDIRMADGDGLRATRAIKQTFPTVRVLLLTSYDAPDYVIEGLRAGADGYLLKGATKDEVLAAIRRALRGETTVQPGLAASVLNTVARKPAPRHPLTTREVSVLRLMAAGQSNAEIAHALGVTLNTVKTHVVHILAKLGAADRTEAAVRATREGLLDQPA